MYHGATVWRKQCGRKFINGHYALGQQVKEQIGRIPISQHSWLKTAYRVAQIDDDVQHMFREHNQVMWFFCCGCVCPSGRRRARSKLGGMCLPQLVFSVRGLIDVLAIAPSFADRRSRATIQDAFRTVQENGLRRKTSLTTQRTSNGRKLP